MTTEKQKMLAGELYNAADEELTLERMRARQLTHRFNKSGPADLVERERLLRELLGSLGEAVIIEPPLFCDYGRNVYIEDSAMLNFGCVLLDCADIYIGRGALLGPAVQLYAATHPTDPVQRARGLERAEPIVIGHNVWIGGGAIILPGVTIGDNTTIGAGSVVSRDLPANVVAAGNPCRILKQLP